MSTELAPAPARAEAFLREYRRWQPESLHEFVPTLEAQAQDDLKFQAVGASGTLLKAYSLLEPTKRELVFFDRLKVKLVCLCQSHLAPASQFTGMLQLAENNRKNLSRPGRFRHS